MKGVDYIESSSGKVIAVVIDLETLSSYQGDAEDLFDGIIAESRKNELRIPFEEVKRNLAKKRGGSDLFLRRPNKSDKGKTK